MDDKVSVLLAARVPPWQAFRLRKLAEEKGLPLGLVLTEAIQALMLDVDEEKIQMWLKEYKGGGHEVD